eukprot:COSAG04_NODE_4873_length_1850_cov_1.957167_1_plen_302_part_10
MLDLTRRCRVILVLVRTKVPHLSVNPDLGPPTLLAADANRADAAVSRGLAAAALGPFAAGIFARKLSADDRDCRCTAARWHPRRILLQVELGSEAGAYRPLFVLKVPEVAGAPAELELGPPLLDVLVPVDAAVRGARLDLAAGPAAGRGISAGRVVLCIEEAQVAPLTADADRRLPDLLRPLPADAAMLRRAHGLGTARGCGGRAARVAADLAAGGDVRVSGILLVLLLEGAQAPQLAVDADVDLPPLLALIPADAAMVRGLFGRVLAAGAAAAVLLTPPSAAPSRRRLRDCRAAGSAPRRG